MLKLKYLEAEVAMDWNLEIPKMYDYMRTLEKQLFEDVDPFIEECMQTIADAAPSAVKSNGGQPQSFLAQKIYTGLINQNKKLKSAL